MDAEKHVESDGKPGRRRGRSVSPERVEEVVRRGDEIEAAVGQGGKLERFARDVKTLLGMVRAYARGDYREVPYWAIAAMVLTLLYLINPLDLIPDFIPGLGQLDDLAVVGLCVWLVRKEISHYRDWQTRQPIEAEAEKVDT